MKAAVKTACQQKKNKKTNYDCFKAMPPLSHAENEEKICEILNMIFTHAQRLVRFECSVMSLSPGLTVN